MNDLSIRAASHRGVAVWFTGLSGAGKTTISEAVAAKLTAMNLRVQLFDAATARERLAPELGFSQEARAENVRRIGFVASLLVTHGVITLVAAMSPERKVRDTVLRSFPLALEVFVDAPLSVCEERDPVGLYQKFRNGEIHHLSGLDDPYEAPLHPDVHCRTGENGVSECANQVVEAVLAAIAD